MPIFEIEQYELHTLKYRVEAETKTEAISKLFNGEACPVDNSLEYILVPDEFGLPVEKHDDLATGLRELGYVVGKHVIPSVRSIKEVK